MKIRALLTIFIIMSCKTSIQTSSTDKNNVLNIEKTNSISYSKGQDKIIFKGENNIVDLIQKNTAFFDDSHDVIIIKGNNNIIKIYNTNIVDLSSLNTRPLIIAGDNAKYVILSENLVSFTKYEISIDSVFIETQPIDFAKFNKEVKSDSEGYQKILQYQDQIHNGDIDAYFQLAEIYNYGLYNIPSNTKKAIELYEYGALNNNIESIRRLADIWYNGGFDKKKNITKGLYFYKLGADLNDSYCIDVLKKLNDSQ
ncbi:tetratricopeptide repeat protein [Marinigracilibium pacificum]|uniref:Sel1 repeat family protein n=1 Tax=Marinigracilibium pacificum TaxID=2729599 RepID=A0A848IZ99_9BACT|nr:SEL1-like repeat protein [Marinigracilibium pacificum]NMM47620.1 sel1 repeat family protein [Marinigracilibium pacificum]